MLLGGISLRPETPSTNLTVILCGNLGTSEVAEVTLTSYF